MTDWTLFAIATVGLTIALLFLTRQSRRSLERIRIVDRDGNPKLDVDGWDAGETNPAAEMGRSDELPPRTFDHPDAVDRDFENLDTPVANAAEPFADDGMVEGSDDDAAVEGSDDDPTVEGNDDDPSIEESDDDPAVEERDDDDPSIDDPDRPVTPAAERAETSGRPTLTTTLLLANVTLSQALALGLFVAIAWWTGVPAAAFGLAGGDLTASVIVLGALAGVGLYAGNEFAAALGKRVGMTASERLRAAMAPSDAREWALLLGVVLPVIAVFEELLFRGALIGAFAFGFGVDPWLLAVGSSVAFGLGHGAQGRLGIVVTGGLGFVLAALFVLTESLLFVIVAHYVINALEFLIHEWLGVDPAGALTDDR